MARAILLHQRGDLRVRVPDLVPLVQDQVVPVVEGQGLLVDPDSGVGGDQDTPDPASDRVDQLGAGGTLEGTRTVQDSYLRGSEDKVKK